MTDVTSKTVDEYIAMETAGTHLKSQSLALEQIDSKPLEQYQRTLQQQGYVIIPDVLSPSQVADIRAAIAPLLEQTGRNFFEGEKTQRIYAVPAKTLVCNALVEHPVVLALLDQIFAPGYLLSQLQVINILAGETSQPIHYDDAFYQLPRPRKPLGAGTVWAIDDFTDTNGSTVMIPGSHRWGDKTPDNDDLNQQIKCEMKAGSVVFFLGTTWHGGGANTSDNSRLAITTQYCEGFCRPQENYSLSVPPARVAECSEDMQRMLGYSVFGPFMGMVNGMHPKRLLPSDSDSSRSNSDNSA